MDFSIYPSPADQWISVRCSQSTQFDLSLIDISGKQVSTWQNVSQQERLDLQNTISAGLHFTQVDFGNGQMVTQKITIRK